jgi:outer membrane protein
MNGWLSKRVCNLASSNPVLPVVASLCAAMLSSQAHALDLLQAYRSALSNDPSLSAAEAAYRVGVEVVPQARANLGPKVQASVSATTVSTSVNQQPKVRGFTREGALTLNQPLLNFSAWRSLDQAKAQLPGIEAQLKAAQQDTMLRVTRAYVDVLLAQDTLEQIQKQKEAIEAQLQRAKRTFAIGTGTVIDREEAQARFDLIAASELQNQGALAVAQRKLEGLMGEPMQGGFQGLNLSPQLASQMLQTDAQTWDALAQERNPAVLQAQATAAAQRQAVEVVRAEYLPTAGLVAGVTQRKSSQSGITLDSQSDGRSTELGVQLAVPLWSSGGTSSRVRQSVAQAEQADDNLTLARRNARQEARQAYINLISIQGQVVAYEQAVESTQVSLNASVRGNEVGARTLIDVLNARQQVFQARTDLARTRYGLVLTAFDLKAAAGSLTEADLQTLSQGMLRATATPALPARELPAVLSAQMAEGVPLRFDLNLQTKSTP